MGPDLSFIQQRMVDLQSWWVKHTFKVVDFKVHLG